MQLRVDQLVPYGYADTAISTFHAFGDRLIREFAFELGLAPDVRVLSRAGGRGLPAGAPVRPRPRGVPAARRPDAVPRRARLAVRPLPRRGRLAGGLRGARRAARGAGSRAGGRSRRRRRGRGRSRCGGGGRGGRPPAGASSRARTARTRRSCASTARSTSATRSSLALQLAARLGRGARGAPGALPLHPRRRVPGHEPGAVGARRAARRAPSERDGRRRRRPVDLPVPRRGDQQHPRVPGAVPRRADRRPAPQLPLARADPRRRAPAHPLQRSRIGSRSRSGSRSGSSPERVGPRRGADPPPRLRHGGRGGGLDRRRDPSARRRGLAAAGPRRAGPRERGRGPDSPLAQRRRACRGGSRERPACTPGRRCGILLALLRAVADPASSVDVYAIAASERYAIPGGGPRGRRRVGAPPAPHPVRGARGARGTAGPAPALAAGPRGAREAHRRTCAATASWPSAGPPARSCTRSCATPAGSRARRRHERRGRGAARQHRPLLRHHPDPVGAPRRRSRRVPRAPPRDADRGRRRPRDRRSRTRTSTRSTS